MPSYWVLIAYAISGAVTAYSENLFCCGHGWYYRSVHIVIGACCLLVVLVTILVKEEVLVKFVLKQFLDIKTEKKIKDN